MSDEAIRVKVVCRVRPLNEKEKGSGDGSVVSFPTASCVALGQRAYAYDHVFQPISSQVEVYSTAARPLVKDVLSGYNATIFAYGQTASGKTHTMEGVLESSEFRGIIPRIVGDIFEHIYSMDANLEIHIKVSYFEIYMEKVRDLLDITKTNLPIGETKNRVPYVKGITERFAASPEEVLAVVEEGKSNRRVAVTNMNAHSSRSHAVFLIAIKQENKESRQTLTGKLYLVDLAGSEKVEKTNAQGLTLEEAKTINKSLLALSNVISALSEGNKPFIPYRDSKLTRVLQESLGGNARTTLIICCSPSPYNEAETKTTLMFGDRAKSIKNKVAVNVELTAEEWRRRFEKERELTQKLKVIVQQHEAELARWRAGEAVPESQQSKLKLKAVSVPVPEESPTHLGQGSQFIAVPTTQLATPTGTPIATPTPLQARAFEEERTRLCQQLDEKEEELQAQTEMSENLSMQVSELEENMEELSLENNTTRKQIMVIEHELLSSQEEVHEVMQALEELAVSYDTKDREIGALDNEKKLLARENERVQSVLEQRMMELERLRETTGLDRRKMNDLLSSIFREVNDVSSVLSPKSEEWLPLTSSSSSSSASSSATPIPDVTDEDFTRVRVQLSNMRCEARSLTEQRGILERAEREAREKAQAVMRELATCKLKLSQYETHNETLNSSLRRSELQKKDMEDSLQGLEGQLQEMRGREESLTRVEREREQKAVGLEHMSRELEEVLEEQRHVFKKQLSLLQEEMVAKEAQIAQITEQYRAQLLQIESLNSRLANLDELYTQEKAHYSRIRMKMRVKEKIKTDLGGLSDTVSHQLGRLNDLRQAYFQCMTAKLKSKSTDDTVSASPSNRELQFLEKNLEDITRVHKKTVSENAEMLREIPRLHSVMASKSKRIGELENLLRETKETFSREYDRLQQENEKIRHSFMAKLKEKERENQHERIIRRQGPQIVRPVIQQRASQPSSSRDTLLAGAGVSVIGQRRKPHQLHIDQDTAGGASSSSSSSQPPQPPRSQPRHE